MNFRQWLILGACLAASSPHAKDLGVSGTIWPIIEIDVRQMMVEDAARTDWTKAQDALKDSAKSYIDNLPKRQLLSPDKTQTEWVDPSIVLSSDIQAPVKRADGTYAWTVIAAKGDIVNPLEKFRPVTAFLLFDGSDEAQLALVKEVLAREELRIIPVETGSGNLNSNVKALRRPVYYANDGMMARFRVRYLPSLVYPGFGEHRLFLGNTSFALPYKAEEVLKAWPDLNSNQISTKKPAP